MLRKLFIFSFVLFAFSAEAFSLPQIYILNPKIDKTGYNLGEEIKGEITVSNSESSVVPGLKVFVKLLTQKESDPNAKIIAFNQGEEFFLLANEKQNKSFSFKLPNYVPKGKLFLKIQVLSSSGEELTWNYQEISILKAGESVKTPVVKLISEGKEVKPMLAINPDDLKIETSGTPEVTIWKKNIGGEVVKTLNGTDLSKISVPGLNKAQIVLNGVPVFAEWLSKGESGIIFSVKCDKDLYLENEKAKLNVVYNVSPIGVEEKNGAVLKAKITDEAGKTIGEASKEISNGAGSVDIEVPVGQSISKFNTALAIESNGNKLASYSFKISSLKTVLVKVAPNSFSNNLYIYILISIISVITIIALLFVFKRKKAIIIFLIFFSFAYCANAESIINSCNDALNFNFISPVEGDISFSDPLVFSGSISLANSGYAFHPANGIALRYFIAPETTAYSYADCCNGNNLNNCASPYSSCPYNSNDFLVNPPNNECVRKCLYNLISVGSDYSGYLYSYIGPSSGVKVSNLPYCGEAKVLNEGNLYYLGTLIISTNSNRQTFVYPNGTATATGDGAPFGDKNSIEFNVTPANMPTLPRDIGFSGAARFYVDVKSVYYNPTEENNAVVYCTTHPIICAQDPYTGLGCLFGRNGSVSKLSCGSWVWNISRSGSVNIISVPEASNLRINDLNYCLGGGQGMINLIWDYSDETRRPQSDYELELNNGTDNVLLTGGSSNTRGVAVSLSGLDLAYNQTYFSRVRVKNGTNWSDWANGPDIITPERAYPSVNFSFYPTIAGAGTEVIFTNDSTCYTPDPVSCKSLGEFGAAYSWDFGDGKGSSDLVEDRYTYEKQDSYNVSLQVNDEGRICTGTKTIGVVPTTPKWIETKPK